MLNEEQAKRYDEVLGWKSAQQRALSALRYVLGESEEDVYTVTSVCPVVLIYVDHLFRMFDDAAVTALWSDGSIKGVFGTVDTAESKPLLKKRCEMMVSFLRNCLMRVAEAIPPGENDGCARHETAVSDVMFRSGAQAAAMTVGLVRGMKLFDGADPTIKLWDDVDAARWYKRDLDLDLLSELHRGSIWLLIEMTATK